MSKAAIAIVGAAETTRMGKVPELSQTGLHADAALNAMAECGLTPADIDGIATAGHDAAEIAQYLGITPTWLDSTSVGGCSFILHVRHAAAAIATGLCKTVLITHGESGRSNNRAHRPLFPSMQQQEFESIYGPLFPPARFTLPVMRKMKDDGLTIEQLAMVAVVQREWAAFHPRATSHDPLTLDDVLSSKMIAWPFTKLMCCLVSDGGGALILTSAERAKDFPTKPVYLRGMGGESCEGPMISQMEDFTTSKAFRVSGKAAFESAGILHSDVDHLMLYDAFAHLPVYGLEDLGFVGKGEGGAFIAEGRTRPGAELPLNTNGGGLSYMHSGMYGMFALQEGVRQMRGTSPAQVKDAKLSVVHGVGGMFSGAATAVLTSEDQW
ncbi:thiolase C-terminal domain-containing protein [Pseudooceanicola spongiae]|uniref:Thiolase n=1 Tax=Pseudooceanicola spongiae TaxID=2613965 RepID=A0A7M3V2S6_9RHOB|nr:thiolase [Pseudooceanicola spongiae]QOL79389.1 thiolase [Pseudooceanicola spongiae]